MNEDDESDATVENETDVNTDDEENLLQVISERDFPEVDSSDSESVVNSERSNELFSNDEED